MPLTDDIGDAITEQDLAILRLEGRQRRQVVRRLRALEIEIIGVLKAIDPTGVGNQVARDARVLKFESELRPIFTKRFRSISNTLARERAELAVLVAGSTARAVNDVAELDVLRRITIDGVEADAASLVEGSSIQSWWRGQRNATLRRAVGSVRSGVRTGESLSNLSRRIAANRRITENQADALVRTALQAVSNTARLTLYQENEDVVRGLQAWNPLDTKTSDICKARAGHAWTLDGDAFPGTFERFPGTPPWHFGCRTTLIPILRSLRGIAQARGGRGRRLRKQVRELAESKKAAFDGVPARHLTFEEMLNRRSPQEQIELLGPGKYKLWKAGRIGMTDLIDFRGSPLTLAQLRERFGEAA